MQFAELSTQSTTGPAACRSRNLRAPPDVLNPKSKRVSKIYSDICSRPSNHAPIRQTIVSRSAHPQNHMHHIPAVSSEYSCRCHVIRVLVAPNFWRCCSGKPEMSVKLVP